MSRSRDDQRRHDNFVDGMIALIVLSAIAIAGCSYASRVPPKDGDWRVFRQEDSIVPRPTLMEAHVPYEGAGPELSSYTPVMP